MGAGLYTEFSWQDASLVVMFTCWSSSEFSPHIGMKNMVELDK